MPSCQLWNECARTALPAAGPPKDACCHIKGRWSSLSWNDRHTKRPSAPCVSFSLTLKLINCVCSNQRLSLCAPLLAMSKTWADGGWMALCWGKQQEGSWMSSWTARSCHVPCRLCVDLLGHTAANTGFMRMFGTLLPGGWIMKPLLCRHGRSRHQAVCASLLQPRKPGMSSGSDPL